MGITCSKAADEQPVVTCTTTVITHGVVQGPVAIEDSGVPEPHNALTFDDVDERARNVPSSVKRTVPALVQYLTEGVTDQTLQVRAFFVWIADNISYDIDDSFGAEDEFCDADSVLKDGQTVCRGFAVLMEAFCTAVKIPVMNLYGYAKGSSYFPGQVFALEILPDHAWNAICLNKTWYLLDTSWAAGYVTDDGEFVKETNEFFFLTDPKQFVNTHFPYMEGNLEASSKWQLLDKPITLQQFNNAVKVHPTAYMFGIEPISHKNSVIELKNEVSLSFSGQTTTEYCFKATLCKISDPTLIEVPNATMIVRTDNGFTVRIHPREIGRHILYLYAGPRGEEDLTELVKYMVDCKEVKDPNFHFPVDYTPNLFVKCVLVSPSQYYLKANTVVKFEVQSSSLQVVFVGEEELQKSGTTFKGSLKVGEPPNRNLNVYGSDDPDAPSLDNLYEFEVK